MKTAKSKFRPVVLLLVLLSACTLPFSPTPIATEPPTPVLVTIDLAGPEMIVGSTFLYADGTVLVAVPGGIFTMGGGGADNPEHEVNVSDFWIYSTKVTNGQYANCVDSGQCSPPQSKADNPNFANTLRANDPMVGVDYGQAAAYCGFVHARLPSEAEWEKTARGPDGNIYPWGDGAPSCDLLNYDGCVGEPTPVNAYPAGRSYYHAFDMEGNTLEWVADLYQVDYYLSAPTDNPPGPDKGLNRVVRSSAFNSGGNQTQAYNRFHSTPQTQRENLGFRCVVDDPTFFAPYCEYPGTYGTDGIGGAATGEQIFVQCPPLAIEQSPYCEGATPITNVSLTGYQGFSATYAAVGGCTSPQADNFVCTGPAQITLCSECQVSLIVPPQCPDGYTWDSDLMTCVGAGAPGECLPGFAFDPTGQCCTPVPAIAAPTVDPLSDQYVTTVLPLQGGGCPAGSWPYYAQGLPPHWECVAVPVESPYCISAGVSLLSCTSGGGGGDDPPVSVCPGVTCGQNYILNPATCNCDCNGC